MPDLRQDSSVVRSIDGLDIGKTGCEGFAVKVLLDFFVLDSGTLGLGLEQLQNSPAWISAVIFCCSYLSFMSSQQLAGCCLRNKFGGILFGQQIVVPAAHRDFKTHT